MKLTKSSMMARVRDSLCGNMFSRREREGFSMWSLRIFPVIEGKGLLGVAIGSKVGECKSDIEGYNLYQEKVSLAMALVATSLRDKMLRMAQST